MDHLSRLTRMSWHLSHRGADSNEGCMDCKAFYRRIYFRVGAFLIWARSMLLSLSWRLGVRAYNTAFSSVPIVRVGRGPGSSVGRAVDWKSSCRWFDSTSGHQRFFTQSVKISQFSQLSQRQLFPFGKCRYFCEHNSQKYTGRPTKCKILSRQPGNNIELSGELIADHLDQKQHQ